MSKPEFRSLAENPQLVEEGNTIEGYAVHWMSLSTAPKVANRNGKPFAYWERIGPYAFRKSLEEGLDVGCYINHEISKILGRIRAGTLEVRLDDRGCFYRCPLPGTSYSNDLKISISRGDIFGNSFGMFVVEDHWEKADDGLPMRTVVEGKLFDVSPVCDPTFEDGELVLNSLSKYLGDVEARPFVDPWLARTALSLALLRR
jgi:HK97 family phage prohead protease